MVRPSGAALRPREPRDGATFGYNVSLEGDRILRRGVGFCSAHESRSLKQKLIVWIYRTTVGAGFILPEASRSGKTDRPMVHPIDTVLLPQDGQGMSFPYAVLRVAAIKVNLA